MVCMSACEQCCRLCNNSIPLKVYKEKFRGQSTNMLWIFVHYVEYMVSNAHTTTISTVYKVTIPVSALSTVFVGVIPFAWYQGDSCLSHILVAVNISLSSNSTMHLLSVEWIINPPLVFMHTWIGTLGFFRNRTLFHPHRFVVAR